VDWPERERVTLEAKVLKRGLFDTSEAANWAPDTLACRVRSYGTFLFFARSRGVLEEHARPASRASGRLLLDFIDHLKERLTPTSIVFILRGTVAILRLIDPDGDRSQVAAAARYFERTAKPRDKRGISAIGSSELYYAGIARMQRLDARATTELRSGVAWSDGLMMAMLAANPIRLRNLHASRVGAHVVRAATGVYEWRFGPSETKNGERLKADLPASLTAFIDRWLREVRPRLARENTHDAMWVTTLGDPMSRSTLYGRFCDATEEELGIRINPHAVRHIAATSIAVSMPDCVRMIPFVLNNQDRTAQEHYNLADGLSASFRYLQCLERSRQRALTAAKRSVPQTRASVVTALAGLP
jgi:hypothetical protein